jgi:hypothetical protein
MRVWEYSGHQGRTRSDPRRPQVSVPLISRPVVSYREGGTTPLWGVWWAACLDLSVLVWVSFLFSRDDLTVCHVSILYNHDRLRILDWSLSVYMQHQHAVCCWRVVSFSSQLLSYYGKQYALIIWPCILYFDIIVTHILARFNWIYSYFSDLPSLSLWL